MTKVIGLVAKIKFQLVRKNSYYEFDGYLDQFDRLFLRITSHPFGMLMPGRVYNTGVYKFGFNNQENENELNGVGSVLSAKYWEYDSRIVKRWNLDPELICSHSRYVAFSDNPIVNIDPNGDVDFRNQKGEYLGHDNHPGDGKIYVITNKSTEKFIKANDANGGTTDVIDLKNHYFELPPYEERQQMKSRIQSLPNDIFYEIGGRALTANDGSNILSFALDGDKSKPNEENAHVNVKSMSTEEMTRITQFLAEHSGDRTADYITRYDWHVHPDGHWVEDQDGKWVEPKELSKPGNNIGTVAFSRSQKIKDFCQTPSFYNDSHSTTPGDVLSAKETANDPSPRIAKNHFVISRVLETIYYYNGSESQNKTYTGSFPLQKFYDVKEGDHK